MEKIKVGFFNCFFPVISGGSEYQTYLLSQCLDPKKFNIFFVSLDSRREGVEEIGGIKVYFFRPRSPLRRVIDEGYISNFRYINSILQLEKPNVVYQRMANSATGILQHLSEKHHFKFVWACASYADLWRPQWFSLRTLRNVPEYLLQKRGIGRADVLLAQTEQQIKIIKKRFQREAILLKNCHPVPKDVPIKPMDKINIIWVANFKPLKQPDLFIDLAALFQDLPMVRFIMIGRPGPGEWQSNLESRIKRLDNLSYIGGISQEDVNAYLEIAHILVNTSQYEGFSNTFIQAWLRRVPVVSLNADPDRLLAEGGLGFCSENFENLCRDIRRLIDNRLLRESIGEKARQYACAQHSIDNVGRKFQELLNSICSTDAKTLKRTENA